MVKIRDLTNQQIVQQLKKYFRFVTALDAERQKRIKQGASEKELYTSEELEAKKMAGEQPKAAESTTIFHLKMDDNQLDELAEEAESIGQSAKNKQYSVSQLINQGKDKKESDNAPEPMREIESDVTSHKLDLAPKRGKKRVFKKNIVEGKDGKKK